MVCGAHPSNQKGAEFLLNGRANCPHSALTQLTLLYSTNAHMQLISWLEGTAAKLSSSLSCHSLLT